MVVCVKSCFSQGRHLYIQLEYSEKEYYESLNDELYFYEKAVVAETYKNHHHYLVIPDANNTEYILIGSREWEEVCKVNWGKTLILSNFIFSQL